MNEESNTEKFAAGFRSLRGGSRVSKARYALVTFKSLITMGWKAKTLTASVAEAEAVYDSLSMIWNTVGLISALMLTICYGHFYSIPFGEEEKLVKRYTVGNFTEFDILGSMLALSTMTISLSLMLCVVYVVICSTIPKTHAVLFIEEFRHILGIPAVSMVFGTAMYVVSFIFWARILVSENVFIVSCAFGCGCMGIVSAIYAYMVFLLDKEGGIWEIAALNAKIQGFGDDQHSFKMQDNCGPILNGKREV
jgi:hypothetical protein